MGCCMCKKCSRCKAWMLVVLGVLFVMQDLGKWDFWGLNWWSVLVLFFGVKMLCSQNCKSCQALGKKK